MKPDSLQLRKLYALTASSCLCAGSLMILKSLWDLFGMPAFFPLPAEKASELLSPAVLLLVSALCLFLLKWSSEKNLRLPLWGGLFLLALLAGAFLFLRERNAFAALSQEEASLVQACARNLSSLPQSASSARLLPALSARTALQLYFFLLILGTAVLLCGLLSYLSESRLWLKGLLLLIQTVILLLCAAQEIPLSKWMCCLFYSACYFFFRKLLPAFRTRGWKISLPPCGKVFLSFWRRPPGTCFI